MFHQTDNGAIESALGRALGLWFAYPGEFRQLAVGSMRADYSWAQPGQDYVKRHHVPPGPAARPQPYYEAKGLSHWELGGSDVPALVTQIADGENGGVMMNEFPPKYFEVIRECSGTQTPAMNVTEYLDQLRSAGIGPGELPAIQPLFQSRI
ncbi:MAG TPA: hypothetical protein VEH31_13650, partial [Streptosporangiaceae bacterium]|nr:hypothetical protein [Streptosporangiaceae bacterium]